MRILYVGGDPSLKLLQFAVDSDMEIVWPHQCQIEKQPLPQETYLLHQSLVGFDDSLMSLRHISTTTAVYFPREDKRNKTKKLNKGHKHEHKRRKILKPPARYSRKKRD